MSTRSNGWHRATDGNCARQSQLAVSLSHTPSGVARALLVALFLLGGWLIVAVPSQAAEPQFVGVLALMLEEPIAAELEINAQQKQDLLKLLDQREQAALELALKIKELVPDERAKQLEPFRRQSEQAALRILTASQQLRLEQLRLKRLGMSALIEPRIADQLKLSTEQRLQVTRLLATHPAPDTSSGAASHDLSRQVRDRLLAEVLDPAQQAAWSAMLGQAEASDSQEHKALSTSEAQVQTNATPNPPEKPESPEQPASTEKPAAAESPAATEKPAPPAKPPVTEPALPEKSPASESPASPERPISTGSQPAGSPSAGSAGNSTPEKTGPQGDPQLKFNFRFAPWGSVIEWFAEQSDLSLVMDAPPPGTFNYTDNRSYTPAEAIDLLNGVLLTKGYTLVRRQRMLMVINLEDGIPPNLVPFVPAEELDKKGEFELVGTLFRVQRMTPEEAEAEIRKLIGPQGSVVVLPKSGQLRVIETAGRLRMMREVINSVEHPEGTGSALRIIEPKHALLGDMLVTLRQLLDIPADGFATSDGSLRLAFSPGGSRLLVSGKPEKIARVEEIVAAIDVPTAGEGTGVPTIVETPQLEVYTITSADSASVLQVLQTLLASMPDVRLATDPKTGHLVALARPSQHATIRATIDQMQRDGRQVEVIRLSRVDPQVAVQSINKLFGAEGEGASVTAPKVEMDLNNRQLLIRGSTAQVEQIRTLLQKMGEEASLDTTATNGDPRTVRMLPLTGRTVKSALEQLQEIWPTLHTNRVRVVSPSAVVPLMQPASGEGASPSGSLVLPPLTVPPSSSNPSPKVTPSPPTSTPESQAPSNPETPVNSGKDEPATKPLDAPPPATTREAARPKVQFRLIGQLPSSPAASGGAPAADESAAPSEAGRPSAEVPEILVAPGPGGVLIASQDTEALDQFEALLTTLSSSTFQGSQQFTVFFLTNASALVVAETLEQIFGGGASSGGGGGGSLLGDLAGAALGNAGGGLMGTLLGLGGSSGGGSVGSGTVQIVPDQRLNALIVQAPPAELDAMEQLLKVLDQRDLPDTEVTPRPRLIAVVNTDAGQIAEIVREVYQDRLSSSSRQRQPSPEEFIAALRGGRGSSSSSRRGASDTQKLSIGVDTRTNSLVVSAPQPLFEEIKQLVDTLDHATEDSNQTVRVVTVKKSNPKTLQRALAALAGDKVTTRSVTDGSVPTTSTSGFSGSASSAGPSSSSSGRFGSSSSGDSQSFDQFRQRIDLFNSLRGGGFGGSPFGGSGGFRPPGGGPSGGPSGGGPGSGR